jgi:Zn-dependent M28 family amino/carboxypeptidase
VLAHAAERASDLAPDDPVIATIRAAISARTIRDAIARYSGAAPLAPTGGPRVRSRHAAHGDNARVVAQLVRDFSVAENVVARARRFWFDAVGGYRSNVEVTFGASVECEAVVLLTAHLDSTAKSESGYDPAVSDAPGADDNASGMAALLAIAHALARLPEMATSACQIRLVLFNGEENGFIGSRRYLDAWPPDRPALVGAIQLDMVGFKSKPQADGRHPFEVHSYARASAAVTEWSLAIARVIRVLTPTVAPALVAQVYPGDLGLDPAQGRSDHASFHHRQIGAVVVSENASPGPDVDSPPATPNGAYHRYTDRVDRLDAGYVAAIASVVAAAAVVIGRSYETQRRASE